MNQHLLIALATGGGLIAVGNIFVALLGPVLNREGTRIAIDKLAMEREESLRAEAEKIRAALWNENAELRKRAETAEATVRLMQSRCKHGCENTRK